MTINIQSLFADIIDTPEQRQQKLLQQGMAQGQLLSSGLRGRAAALAPLAQMAGQLGVQRNEDLRRAVQPMLGIDPRTTGERLQDQLKNIDTSTPQGLLKAAQAVQQIDPVRAAALRQAAAELTKEEEERSLRIAGERQRQELAGQAATRDQERLQLQTGEFLQRMQDSALQNQQLQLNITRLEGTISDEEARRNLEGEARDAKKTLETSLADAYATNPANAKLVEFLRSGLAPVQTLESLVTTKPTEWEYRVQQFFENGEFVNYDVAIDKSNPENTYVMQRAKEQPEKPKAEKLPEVPALNDGYREDYNNVIDSNPTLSAFVSEERNWITADKPAMMQKEELTDLMHTLRFQYTLPLAQVNTIITDLARQNPEALLRGIVPMSSISLGQSMGGSGGNPPLDEARPQGTVAQPSALTNDVLAQYPEFRVLTGGRQPIPPQPEALPNPFNVGISTEQPTAPDMRLGTPATGFDAAFERQITMEENRVREGIVSPSRLNVIRNNYVSALEKNKTKLQNELRYLKGLSKQASPNKESRISAVQTQLDSVNNKLQRYKTTS